MHSRQHRTRSIVSGLATVAMAAGAFVTLQAGAASAAPADQGGARASFEGKTIDLSKGWQGAHTCAVFSEADVRCYDTAAEADRATGYQRAKDPLVRNATSKAEAAKSPACASGWFCLYQYEDGGGKRLIFSDGYWHNLDDYGFNDKTSSIRNRQWAGDNGNLSQHAGGDGATRTFDSPQYVSDLGWFDNRASAVHG